MHLFSITESVHGTISPIRPDYDLYHPKSVTSRGEFKYSFNE
jgi:hypothetical protein